MRKNPKLMLKWEATSVEKNNEKQQVRTIYGKSIENMMVSDGAEPRFVLYSSLILHFGRFRKREKNQQKLNEKTT